MVKVNITIQVNPEDVNRVVNRLRLIGLEPLIEMTEQEAISRDVQAMLNRGGTVAHRNRNHTVIEIPLNEEGYDG